LNKAKNS